jgi:hypothetical protein
MAQAGQSQHPSKASVDFRQMPEQPRTIDSAKTRSQKAPARLLRRSTTLLGMRMQTPCVQLRKFGNVCNGPKTARQLQDRRPRQSRPGAAGNQPQSRATPSPISGTSSGGAGTSSPCRVPRAEPLASITPSPDGTGRQRPWPREAPPQAARGKRKAQVWPAAAAPMKGPPPGGPAP